MTFAQQEFDSMRRFDRLQLELVVDSILSGVMDRLYDCLPKITSEDGQEPDYPSAYKDGVLEQAGESLSILYARLTDDGMGCGDALDCAMHFNSKVEHFLDKVWEDNGKKARKALSKAKPGTPYNEIFAPFGYPDIGVHAAAFVENAFDVYLKGRISTEQSNFTPAEQSDFTTNKETKMPKSKKLKTGVDDTGAVITTLKKPKKKGSWKNAELTVDGAAKKLVKLLRKQKGVDTAERLEDGKVVVITKNGQSFRITIS